jgi:hypothetical protein
VETETHQVEFNKVFEFDFGGQVQFGDLPLEEVYELYKDGRVSSKFLEHYIPIWFPELKFVDQDGYDHIDANGVKYDLKGFTISSGAGYAPSNMVGAGRKINISEMHAHAKTINYIFSDITKFPEIRIIFKTGEDMVRDYPNGKIKPNQRDKLFPNKLFG